MKSVLPPGPRLGLFYASLFANMGILLPFWPLYLAAKGLDATEIGALVAATYLARIASNPLAGALADRTGERRRLLMALSLVSTIAALAFAPADGFWPLLAVTVITFGASTATLPLADTLTLLCVGAWHLDYGRIRLWGSVAFIAVAGAGGALLVDAPRDDILLALIGTFALSFVVAFVLPEAPASGKPESTARLPLSRFLTNPTFVVFLVASSLVQLSHTLYYGFATLHWRAAGLSGPVIGGLWAESVVAEVILFAFGTRLLTRWGPVGLMASGGIAGIIRWTVLAVSTDPIPLAVVQSLHAFTFAATHLGAMHFINRAVPAENSAAGLGIYASVTMGVVPGLALLGAGRLYANLQGSAFLAMSLAAALGLAATLALKRLWRGGRVITAPMRQEARP